MNRLNLFKSDSLYRNGVDAQYRRRSIFRNFQWNTGVHMAQLLSATLVCALVSTAATLDVEDFGAIGDGETLNTAAIQSAINACQPGDTLRFHHGRYRTGQLILKGRVNYLIEPSATILGSNEIEDYPPHRPDYANYWRDPIVRSLIFAYDQSGITISGGGTIDGDGGASEPNAEANNTVDKRVSGTRFYRCEQLRIENITLRNFNCWGNLLDQCKQVIFRNVTVDNAQHNHHNMDGIDIQDCHQVTIENCRVRSVDDAICLKSWSDHGIRDVRILNTTMHSTICNALKIGTYTVGPIENIELDHCTLICPGYSELARIGTAVSIQAVDGSDINGVRISDCHLVNHGTPFFIRLGNRDANKTRKTGSIQNIRITGVTSEGPSPSDDIGCIFTGLPGHPIRNIELDNIELVRWGGVQVRPKPLDLEELEEHYPEAGMFGRSPAYGFFIRHAENVKLHDIRSAFQEEDARPWISTYDVSKLTTANIKVSGQRFSPSDKVLFIEAERPCSEIPSPAPGLNPRRYIRLNAADSTTVSYRFQTSEPSDIELFVKYRTPVNPRSASNRFRYRLDDGAWRTQGGYEVPEWTWLRTYLLHDKPDAGINEGLAFTDTPPGVHQLTIQAIDDGIEIDSVRISCQQGSIDPVPASLE